MKNVVVVYIMILIVLISFSSCGSLSKFLVTTEHNSESNPGGRVALGLLNRSGSGTNDTASWYFDRDESGQYYFEYSYHVRIGNLMDNVMVNMVSSINLDNITIKINNNDVLSLTGSPVPKRANTFRFPVSTTISNQLLNCNSFTLQAVSKDTHEAHHSPFDVWEYGRGIVEVKRFINYWNDGGTSVNVTSANTEKPKVDAQTGENNKRDAQTTASKVSTSQTNTNQRRIHNYGDNRKLRNPSHPPNCCHNIF